MAFTVLLAAPRGFCAGVDRAIRTVELALEARAPGDERPVYVRHEIVHNKVVVDDLRARGAVFVEDTGHSHRGDGRLLGPRHLAGSARRSARPRPGHPGCDLSAGLAGP